MAEPLVLTFNLDAPAGAEIDRLCDGLGLRRRAVEPGEWSTPIGALAGIPVGGTLSGPSGSFSDAMLVVCSLSRPQMDAFLNGLRARGVATTALKAVLTPTNVRWNAVQLRNELSRERDAINRRRR